MKRLEEARDFLKRIREGASKEFGYGREDQRQAYRRSREDQGLEIDATRGEQMIGSNRTYTMMQELLGRANPADVQARQSMGLGLSEDRATRIGQVLGTLGSDLVQDRGRELWWLINAPQALANLAQDTALKQSAPDLFKTDLVVDVKGNPVESRKQAFKMGIADKQGRPNVGYTRTSDGYAKRKHEPGFVDALNIPAGIAVNTAIGLMTPFGGAEGYKAVFEDENDPTKSTNPVMEVGAKYILGRTGGLLPWDEFKKIRPDVSKDEYMRYKAFKFDNETDLNPLDGDIVLPTGVLKATTEGIHGPEVQFLGRSLPISTAFIPTAAAIGSTAYGARRFGPKGGLATGLAGTAAGMLLGNALENERRRRNAEENNINQIDRIY